jgi:hypothetical protein
LHINKVSLIYKHTDEFKNFNIREQADANQHKGHVPPIPMPTNLGGNNNGSIAMTPAVKLTQCPNNLV